MRALTVAGGGTGAVDLTAAIDRSTRGARKVLRSTALCRPGPSGLCSRLTTGCLRSIRPTGARPTVPVLRVVATITVHNRSTGIRNPSIAPRQPASSRTANLPNGLPRLLGIALETKDIPATKRPLAASISSVVEIHRRALVAVRVSVVAEKASVAAEKALVAVTQAAGATRAEAV